MRYFCAIESINFGKWHGKSAHLILTFSNQSYSTMIIFIGKSFEKIAMKNLLDVAGVSKASYNIYQYIFVKCKDLTIPQIYLTKFLCYISTYNTFTPQIKGKSQCI